MSIKIIREIFQQFLFVIGVVLTIIGFVVGLSTGVKSVAFESYPLQEWNEMQCDNNMYPIPVTNVKAGEEMQEPDQKAQDEWKKTCETKLLHQRKVNQVNDITMSVGLLVSGLVVVGVFGKKEGSDN